MSTPNQQQQHSTRNVDVDDDEHLGILNKLHACCDPGEFQELLLQARALNLDFSMKFRIEKKEKKNNNSDGNENEKIEEEEYYGTILHGAVLDEYDWKMRAIFEEVEARRKLQIEEKEKDSNEEEEEKKKRKQISVTTGDDGGGKRLRKESSKKKEETEETEEATTITTRKKTSNEVDESIATSAAKIARKDENNPSPEISVMSLLLMTDSNGQTPLHIGAASSQVKTFQTLVEACPREGDKLKLLLTKNNNGDTPIHLAVRSGNWNIIQCILEQFSSGKNEQIANIFRTTIDKNGQTILHWAAAAYDTGNISKIMSFDSQICLVQDNQGKTALHHALLCEKKDSYRYGFGTLINSNEETIELILKADNEGKTVLNYCVEMNDFRLLYDLRRVSFNDRRFAEALRKTVDKDGRTILHLEASKHGGVVEWLVSLDEELCSQQDNSGKTALHLAAENNLEWCFSAIIKGCNTEQKQKVMMWMTDKQGHSAIEVAIRKDQIRTVQWIGSQKWATEDEKIGELLCKTVDDHGQTLLHRAVKRNAYAVGAIVSICNDLLFIRDKDGRTALHIAAASRGSVDAVKGLLSGCKSHEERMKFISLEDNFGQTMVQVAANFDCFSTVEYLLKQEWLAKEEQTFAILRTPLNAKGETILHQFARAKIPLKMINMLMTFDASLVFIQDVDGRTALHVAAASQQKPDVFKAILAACETEQKQKQLLWMADKLGNSVIHDATANTHFEIVRVICSLEWILEDGKIAELLCDTVDENGQTILHRAARANSHSIIRMLSWVSNDLIFMQDNNGKTALHFAASWGLSLNSFVALLDACQSDCDKMTLILIKDNSGRSVIQNHVNVDSFYIMDYLIKQRWFVKDKRTTAMLRTPVNDKGETILHRAALRRKDDLIEFLLTNDSTIFAMKDNEGYTALHRAIIEVVKDPKRSSRRLLSPSLLFDKNRNPRTNIDPNIKLGLPSLF